MPQSLYFFAACCSWLRLTHHPKKQHEQALDQSLNLGSSFYLGSFLSLGKSISLGHLSITWGRCMRSLAKLGQILLLILCLNLGLTSLCLAGSSSALNNLPEPDKLNANLPNDLFTTAVIDNVVFDPEFDYTKLKRIASLPIFPAGYRAPKNLVDRVVVNKSHHKMLLYKGDQVIRSYWIALSDRPEGTKVRQGDKRTPEGVYTLDYIKEDSYYYRAFHISYPNNQDIQRARKLGVNPGGMIMVHGQPPSKGNYQETIQRSDWTNGCIAILNHEIDEFISLVDPGTPIEINP